MPKLILTHSNTLFSPCLAACDFSPSPVLSVKRRTRIDYTCKEARGKMKEGGNEKATVGADGASATRRFYLTLAQISGISVTCTQKSR